ncbi:acyl carrier protein [Massilia sp. PAMC28688]|uniref:acyl carrier protein n=1 Tax=Massilia sp. PAMC28688 TaxID=2861283 RepID=UPI001C627EB4|nr:acyl carrier protein [Massilia sp. PAMC28688]QYF93469.1 acyl carrier protein [Massilia sp. PAMC28688]
MDQNKIFETIATHARDVMPALATRQLNPTDSLKALGANSIDRSEIIMMTLESLGLEMSLVELARAENMGELSEIMGRRMASA